MAKIELEEPCPCGSEKPYGECHEYLTIKYERIKVDRRFKLTIISEPYPNYRAIFDFVGADSRFLGDATHFAYQCGSCGNDLLVGVNVTSRRWCRRAMW